MSKMVPVKEKTKEKLEEIKDQEEHTSFDSVIKTLIQSYESTPDPFKELPRE